MSSFDSLAKALEGWFEKSLLDLPDELRQRVEREFVLPWERMSADQRRRAALQLDYQRDPATELERQHWTRFFDCKSDLEQQIAVWEAVDAPFASDLARKENRLSELRQKLARMVQQQREARGDYPGRKRLDVEEGVPRPLNVRPGVRGSTAGDDILPPLKMDFDRSEIESIASEDFAVAHNQQSPVPEESPVIVVGSTVWRSQTARAAANARHDRPGGSREKQQQIRQIWATGKYTSRDRCAEEECAALGMSFSAARKALINTPNPS